jgi:hypothetical protein
VEQNMATTQVRRIEHETSPQTVQLPAPTAWPIVLAFGITLLFAGLVTTVAISVLGAICALAGSVGWFRSVLPHEQHESVPLVVEPVEIVTTRREVSRVPIAENLPRAFLPLETYPISAGIKGGLAGAVAMAIVASAYGLIAYRSVWYPINLLAAIVYARASEVTTAQMAAFHFSLLLVALAIHVSTSLLVGVLYGALLPMFPRRPIVLGGFFAPLLWTGLLYTMLEYINPVLNQRINWFWFIASQFAFGIAAGIVVARQQKIRTFQGFPFAVRAGIEAPGAMSEKRGEGKEQK